AEAGGWAARSPARRGPRAARRPRSRGVGGSGASSCKIPRQKKSLQKGVLCVTENLARRCRRWVKICHCDDVRCMTVLPPKAEVHPRSCYVAQVPKAAVSNRSKTVALFDHLIGAGEQRRWHFEAECALAVFRLTTSSYF